MPEAPPDGKRPILDYRPASAEPHRVTTRATRIVAALASAFFAAMALDAKLFPERLGFPDHAVYPWIATAGSIFCLLIALGVIGRNRA